MIKIEGSIMLRMPFSVTLDITEEKFDSLSESEQDALIDEAINWESELRNAEITETEIDDVQED